MKLPSVSLSIDLSQLIYAIFVVILVPGLLTFNTIFLLKNMQRDMDFELNNKALIVETAIGLQIKDKLDSSDQLQANLTELISNIPELKAIEVYTLDQQDLSPLISTSEKTKQVADVILNNLAWGSNKPVSKQIYASLGSSSSERMWLVAAPIMRDGEKVGLINLYLSASPIDQISSRTFNDSLMVLFVTMLVVTLLLINHFRFVEFSLMFKRLSELDKLKDDFISMASHELKTPLTAISGYAHVLMESDQIRQSPQVYKDITIINESTRRLRSLIDDILDVSRIEQKKMKLNMQNCDLSSIIVKAINELTPIAQVKGLTLTYQKPTKLLVVKGDLDKLSQIFVNIIGNALKYTVKGGVIVYHQEKNGRIITFVKDSGIGISEEDRSKLFNKFMRIYNNQTRFISGTGLGLWITKQLVEKMNGKIAIESIEGQGTQLIISFPRAGSRG